MEGFTLLHRLLHDSWKQLLLLLLFRTSIIVQIRKLARPGLAFENSNEESFKAAKKLRTTKIGRSKARVSRIINIPSLFFFSRFGNPHEF